MPPAVAPECSVIAYTQTECISHSDCGEYLRALTRWLVKAESLVEG